MVDSKNLLESILADGKVIAEKSLDVAQGKLGVPEKDGAERDAMLDGMQKGVLTAGALALLLGTGAGRRLTGAAIKLGSVAAVGGLAYNAYSKWQAQLPKTGGGVKRIEPATPRSELKDDTTQKRNVALIRAMVAAAKADGHVDEAEKKAMLELVDQQQFDEETLAFLKKQISSDVTVAEIAALADSPEAASEMYLACRIVIDQSNDDEKAWLASLSSELKLSAELIAGLEEEVVG